MLSRMGSFYFDEMASVTIANFNFPEILEYFVIENNPPLHFLYLHFWIKIFGDGEIAVRISSLIFGLLAIPLTYLVGKEIFSKKTGLIAAAFMAISPGLIYFSVEARMYSMLLSLSLFSIYFYWKILKENKKISKLFYVFSSILLIYSHFFGYLVIIFQNIFFFVYRKNYQHIKIFFYKINIILIIVFSFWFIPKFLTLVYLPVSQGWYFAMTTSLLNIFSTFEEIIGITHNNRFLHAFCFLLIFALIITDFILFIKQWKKNNYTFGLTCQHRYFFVYLWIIIPVFLSYIGNLMISKYLIFITPALYLLIAQAIVSINLKLRIRKVVLMTVVVFIMLFIAILPRMIIKNKIYYWDEVADYISFKEKSGDKIILHSFVDILEFRRYFKANAPYEGFYIFNDENDDLEKIIIKHNWNHGFINNDIAVISDKLNIMTKNYKRIFLIDSIIPTFDPHDFVVNWFPKNNWRLIERKMFNYKLKPCVWIWEKID
ncbi:MAG: glycosyltransferase family 39 protein [Patescibacteria group bacterium]|nr:glycosyltransferase family 39 protein [Patescibacteria group bacterium]